MHGITGKLLYLSSVRPDTELVDLATFWRDNRWQATGIGAKNPGFPAKTEKFAVKLQFLAYEMHIRGCAGSARGADSVDKH